MPNKQENDSIYSTILNINEIIYTQLIKGIYKIHNNNTDNYIDFPIINKIFSIVFISTFRNKIFYTTFNKDFLILDNIIYLNKKLEKIIENYGKTNLSSQVDLFILLGLIDYLEHIHKYDKKQLGVISYFLGYREIEFVYKKVQGRLEKFITKDMLFNQKVIGFYKYNNIKNKVFFSTETAKEIRAIQQKGNNKECLGILDIGLSLTAISRLKQNENGIYNNLFLYFLSLKLLEYIKNNKEKISISDQKIINIFIKFLIGYAYQQIHVKQMLGFNLSDIDIFNSDIDRDALRNFLKEYFTILISDLKKIIKNNFIH